MVKSPYALLGVVCYAAGCFRILARHPCGSDDPPAYCVDATTVATSTSGGPPVPDATASIFTTSPPYFRGGMPHGLKGAADLLCDLTRRNGAEVVEAADRTIV